MYDPDLAPTVLRLDVQPNGSVNRIEAGASTSARMADGFSKAYAEHYAARGDHPKVLRPVYRPWSGDIGMAEA